MSNIKYKLNRRSPHHNGGTIPYIIHQFIINLYIDQKGSSPRGSSLMLKFDSFLKIKKVFWNIRVLNKVLLFFDSFIDSVSKPIINSTLCPFQKPHYVVLRRSSRFTTLMKMLIRGVLTTPQNLSTLWLIGLQTCYSIGHTPY